MKQAKRGLSQRIVCISIITIIGGLSACGGGSGSASASTTTPAGSTGSTPPAGSTGSTPPAGSTGSTPPAGSTGSTPPAGSAGSTPPAGSTGSTPPAGSTGSTPPAGSTGATSTSGGPTIKGTAITTATVGKAYSFKPQATDPNNAVVTFTIANKPAWASFDPATGLLSGTPTAANVGTYSGVEISATNGSAATSLPAFTITVSASGASNVTLSWEAPTQNSDGTALTDLKGYTIHYGSAPQAYTSSIAVDNPGLTSYVVSNLPAGTYYFAITALNSAGLESTLSDEVAKSLN